MEFNDAHGKQHLQFFRTPTLELDYLELARSREGRVLLDADNQHPVLMGACDGVHHHTRGKLEGPAHLAPTDLAEVP